LELFSDDRVAGRDAFADALVPAHVYNLHWVATFVDYRRFFGRLAPATPLVWTLHDMNPMTGGCHYALGCERFTALCGACVQLGSRTERDLSRRIFERKAAALKSRALNTTRIVAPSAWLAGEALRSGLLGRFEIDTIPSGVDCNIFQPRSRATAREVFGLSQDKAVVLFAADSVKSHRKGFDLLVSALQNLSADRAVTLAAIGEWSEQEKLPVQVIALGRIESERLLSFAYSAADVFVLPTRADNLPNVILEAMACGTPVISFDVGGVRDAVRPGWTGLLAPPGDIVALRNAILTLLADNSLRERLSNECRRVAVAEYEEEIQARRYLGVYETLLNASGHLKAKRELSNA
jgi:glycosyltransferase involved in cell wall biosynthesis